jgi:RimJ/RimL family protein N-acetyltransferase
MRADTALQHMLLANPPPGGDGDVPGWIARREAGGRLWAIADAETDACLGFVQLADINRKNALGWLGIALAPQARGRGLGRAAMASLEDEARAMGLRKLLLQVRTDNPGAIALYERAGFARAGVLRRHYDDGERLHDVLVMERLLA